MTVFLCSVLAALVVSALCSLLEATLLSLTPRDVAQLTSRRPRLGALWQHFKEHIEQPIAVILLLNTAAHTIGATIAGAKFEELFGDEQLLWFSLLFTLLMLQFTEILPKILAVRYNRELAPLIAFPLQLVVRVLSPLLYVVHLVNKPFEGKRDRSQPEVALEEIAALAGLARLANLIGSHQERIITGAIRLSQLRAHQVMIPLEQVVFLSTTQTVAEALVAAETDAHTRFPICDRGNHDQVLGYVNFKELVYLSRTPAGTDTLHSIIRPVQFVAAEHLVTRLLEVFVDQHTHMALVQDANGKTLGLVTLEDVLEELVGELEDEFDRLPRTCSLLSGRTWLVGGGLPLQALANQLGVVLPEMRGTTSAWIIQSLQRVPKPRETFSLGGLVITIRRVRRGKIVDLSVAPLVPPPAPSDREQLSPKP